MTKDTITRLKELKETHKDEGETLYYKDGNEAGVVKEVTKKGYVVEPSDGGDWFFVKEEDTKQNGKDDK